MVMNMNAEVAVYRGAHTEGRGRVVSGRVDSGVEQRSSNCQGC